MYVSCMYVSIRIYMCLLNVSVRRRKYTPVAEVSSQTEHPAAQLSPLNTTLLCLQRQRTGAAAFALRPSQRVCVRVRVRVCARA